MTVTIWYVVLCSFSKRKNNNLAQNNIPKCTGTRTPTSDFKCDNRYLLFGFSCHAKDALFYLRNSACFWISLTIILLYDNSFVRIIVKTIITTMIYKNITLPNDISLRMSITLLWLWCWIWGIIGNLRSVVMARTWRTAASWISWGIRLWSNWTRYRRNIG